jgi:Lon protease-like protein
VLGALVRSLDGKDEADPWRGLFALSARLSEPARRHIAASLAELDETSVAALPAHATDATYWPALLQLLAESEPAAQSRVAEIWSRLSPEWQAGIERHIHENRYDTRLSRITSALTTVTAEEVFFRRRQQIRQRGEDHFASW